MSGKQQSTGNHWRILPLALLTLCLLGVSAAQAQEVCPTTQGLQKLKSTLQSGDDTQAIRQFETLVRQSGIRADKAGLLRLLTQERQALQEWSRANGAPLTQQELTWLSQALGSGGPVPPAESSPLPPTSSGGSCTGKTVIDQDFSGDWKSRMNINWFRPGATTEITYVENGGDTCMRTKFRKGRDGASWPKGYPDGYGIEVSIPPAEHYYQETDLIFEEGWDFTALGGKLPNGLCGGTCSNGGDGADGSGFSSRLTFADGGTIKTYVYHKNQPTRFGDTKLVPGFSFKTGVRYTMGQEVILNTPGKSDGIKRVYINGKLMLEHRNLHFRDSPNIKIDRLWSGFSFGGGSAPFFPNRDVHAQFCRVKLVANPTCK